MKKIINAFALFLIFFSSCKKDNNLKTEQPHDSGETITYNLKNGGKVSVFVTKKGQYLLAGDVILSDEQISYLKINSIDNKTDVSTESTFTAEFQKFWPNGIIYYTINDPGNSQSINSAITQWETKTPIRFIQRTNQFNYIDFAGLPDQGAGDSQLGMIGGRQTIRLVASASVSTIVHEIGHAVGLMHEQTRTDRDNYININYSNIINDWKFQYDTYSVQGRAGNQMGTFDFQSIMLYPSYATGPNGPAFPGNTTPQMTRKDGSTFNRGTELSQGDIAGVNALYKRIYLKRKEIILRNESNMDEQHYESDVYVEFYSDEACSIPYILPIRITLFSNVFYIEKVYSNTVSQYEMEVYTPLEPGNSSYYVGKNKSDFTFDFGRDSGSSEYLNVHTLLHPNYAFKN